MSYRDRDSFQALIDILSSAGEFASVAFGLGSDPRGTDLMPRPLVRLAPDGWTETPDSTPGAFLRTVRYSLTIAVAHPDPWERFLAADRLSAVAQNLLDGSDLAGTCLAALSKLERGRFPSLDLHPELRIVLEGSFSYRIPSPGVRDVSR